MLYFLVSNYTAGCLQLYSFQLLKRLPQKKQYSWCNCFFVSRLLSALPWLTQRLELLIYFHVSGSNIFFEFKMVQSLTKELKTEIEKKEECVDHEFLS